MLFILNKCLECELCKAKYPFQFHYKGITYDIFENYFENDNNTSFYPVVTQVASTFTNICLSAYNVTAPYHFIYEVPSYPNTPYMRVIQYAYKCDPEMRLGDCVGIQVACDLGEPEIPARENRKHRTKRQHIVEMGHHIIGVMQ